jgi:hypothetical protein
MYRQDVKRMVEVSVRKVAYPIGKSPVLMLRRGEQTP